MSYKIVSRSGFMDIPPTSLIDLTHKFAFYIKDVYWQASKSCY